MFGQAKPTFGIASPSGFSFGASSFGTPAASTQQGTGLFGQPATAAPQNNVFGNSVFGGTSMAPNGTTVKFNPPVATDSIQKNGQKTQVNTKHVCITAMKEYQDKCLEELRVEDYLQNRKSGSAVSGTSMFGAATATKPLGFGAATTSATPLFGAATAATQSSLFGTTSNTGTSIFGSTQPMNSFGQNTQSSLFGSKPMFGGANTTTSALNLGQQQPAQTGFGFGQPAQNSIFGAKPAFGGTPTTTTTGFSLFGAQPAATQSSGFAFGKPQGGGIFGAPTTTTNSPLFGAAQPAAQASPFGQPVVQSGGIFGAKPAAGSLFRTTTTTAAAPAFGGFGTAFAAKTTASTGLFGTNPAVNSTGFGLGVTATSNAQPILGGGLFGAKKTSSFGSPAAGSTGFGFGTAAQTAQPATNLFGATPGFGLGASSQPAQPTTNLFGANTAATGGLFNKPAPGGFSFGQTNSTAPSLFGTNAPLAVPGTSTPSLFGTTGFGATPSLGFGASTGLGGTTGLPAFGAVASTNQTALNPLVEQLSQNARAQQHVLDMVRSMPYGQSSLFRHLGAEPVSHAASSPVPSSSSSLTNASKNGAQVLSASAAASTLAEIHKANTLSVGRSPGRVGSSLVGRRPMMQSVPINRRQLFTGFHEDDALVSAQSPVPGDRKNVAGIGGGRSSSLSSSTRASLGTDNRFFVRREAWKRLNIPNSVRASTIQRSSLVASQFDQHVSDGDDAIIENRSVGGNRLGSVVKPTNSGSGDNAATVKPPVPTVQFLDSPSAPTPFLPRNANDRQERKDQPENLASPAAQSQSTNNTVCEANDTGNWTLPPDVTLNQTATGVPEDYSNISDDEDGDARPTTTSNEAGIRLSKPGYYMFPSVDELGDLIDENGRCVVHDFVIGRQSYGHILFPGPTDITGIDFDEAVHIRRREVVVYPDDATKPPLGYGLNRKAEITLDGVWPTDKSTREFIKSPQRLAAIRFDERLEKATQKMDATFIEYRADTGSWVFEVKHFSKYRLDDSDDEGDGVAATGNTTNATTIPRHPLNVPSRKQSVLEDDNQRTVTTTGVDVIMPHIPPVYMEREDTLMSSSSLRLSCGAFRGVRDSLFLASNGGQDGEAEIDDDDDDGAAFLRRRRDGGTKLIGLANDSSLLMLQTATDSEMVVKTSPVTNDSAVIATPRYDDAGSDDYDQEAAAATAFGMKIESLQSVHNPIPLTLSKAPTIDVQSTFKVPYEKIAKLCGVTPEPNPKHLLGCHFDATLARGDTCRISWGLLRGGRQRNGQQQQTLLMGDLRVDPVASIVATAPPAVSADENEEVLLNAALKTSSPALADIATAMSVSCPQFCPATGPGVLETYLACTDTNNDAAVTFTGTTARSAAFRRALLACQALWAAHHQHRGDEREKDITSFSGGLHEHFKAKKNCSADTTTTSGDEEEEDDSEESIIAIGVDKSGQQWQHSQVSPGMKSLARKQAVSEWIRAELRPSLDARLKELGLSTLFMPSAHSTADGDSDLWSQTGTKVTTEAVCAGIFAAMCCGEPLVACRLALAHRMSHLASCLSMAPISDPLCKRGLKKQIIVWNELKVLPFMPRDVLRTYALLAGEIQVPLKASSCNEGTKQTATTLNVLAGLPYIQALGVHLWYIVDHSDDLANALKLFSHNWHAQNLEVAPPQPPRDSELMHENADKVIIRDAEPTERNAPRDICYHLMRLASRPWHSLERTLDPFSIRQRNANSGTNSDNPGDWPSAWHLWRTLTSLGLTSLNPMATSRVHSEFAAHLETLGLWEWAVFVLLHEADHQARSVSVKRLLARCVSLQRPLPLDGKQMGWRMDEAAVSQFTDAELFIIERLGVPAKWLHEAKACLARSLLVAQSALARHESRQLLASLEAAHWLAAGHLEAAHTVYMKHLLPELVLHSNNNKTYSTLLNTNGCFSAEGTRGTANLATKLLAILQPFVDVPNASLPTTFDLGAGVYLVYGRILYLTHQLALCNASQNNDDDEKPTDADIRGQDELALGVILEQLQSSTHQLVDLLQSMPTPSTRERVVKNEMAMTALRLISAFFPNCPLPNGASSNNESFMTTDGVNSTTTNNNNSRLLCQRLDLIAKIGVLSEARLTEMEALSAAGFN